MPSWGELLSELQPHTDASGNTELKKIVRLLRLLMNLEQNIFQLSPK